jgi:hypothetical protein
VHVAAENTSSGIRVRRVSDRNIRETKEQILFVVIRGHPFIDVKTVISEDEPDLGGQRG